ncbi:neural proliferation differentiation and control protein 1a isoform X2 [Amia ocellicauda]|uniref:neural proliferation differentiation and control protein 1a isoform X2 n=1 Tax=Amia ocellicauda TaxID=2972642 RepID=UPI0034641DA9
MLPRLGAPGGRPGSSLLLGLWVCTIVVTVSDSLSVSCPHSLDCALKRRELCPPGSTHCGPCIAPLVEDELKNCVRKKHSQTVGAVWGAGGGRCLCVLPALCVCSRERHRHSPPPLQTGKVSSMPELDEEIDFLSSIIAKEQESVGASSAVSGPPPQSDPKKNDPTGPVRSHTPMPTRRPGSTTTTTTVPPPTKSAVRSGPVTTPYARNDTLLIIMIAVCILVGTAALIVAGICWVRLQKEVRLAQKVDYPAFGVMGPNSFDSTSPGDKKLAHSAQMYHYQHQKQQMLSMEKHTDEPKVPDSGTTTDEENEDGDFTVYECPGLAPTGEMEVKNPLFDDSSLHPQRNHK